MNWLNWSPCGWVGAPSDPPPEPDVVVVVVVDGELAAVDAAESVVVVVGVEEVAVEAPPGIPKLQDQRIA